jgi:hypothetical protein
MTARPFFKTVYRGLPGQQDDGDHWLGGPACHRGAICPNCKIPLLLLWDISPRDPRFPRGQFGPLERLPLYFCWGCLADIAYQVPDPGRLKIVSSTAEEGKKSFPYDPFPEHFERLPLAFATGMPGKVKAVIASWNMKRDPLGEGLSDEDKHVLARYFGHDVSWPIDLFHHQFGGVPLQRLWGEEIPPCPNGCRGLLGKRRAMRFLAGIVNDPGRGLPFAEPASKSMPESWNCYVTVQFHICGHCWTTHASHRYG